MVCEDIRRPIWCRGTSHLQHSHLFPPYIPFRTCTRTRKHPQATMSLQNRLRLSGRVAIVTGGSRGIGERIALELAQNGAKVSITYTSTGSAAHSDLLVKSINSLGNGSSAIAIKADLRDPASPEKIVAQTIEHFGESIDILVNNAGVELVKPIKDVTVADFGWVYDLNVRAPMLMLQAILPYLRAPGRIINISSVGARHGFKNLSVYCSSNQHLKD